MVDVDPNELLSASWSEAILLHDLKPERAIGEQAIKQAFWGRVWKATELTQSRVAETPNLRELIVSRFSQCGDALADIRHGHVDTYSRIDLSFLVETNPELRGQQRRMYSRRFNFVDLQEAVFTTFDQVDAVLPGIDREFGARKLALPPVGVIASRFVAHCGAYKEPLLGTVYSAHCLYVYPYQRGGEDYGPKIGCLSRIVREWDPATKQLLGYIHRDAYVNMANLIMATSNALARAIQTPYETASDR